MNNKDMRPGKEEKTEFEMRSGKEIAEAELSHTYHCELFLLPSIENVSPFPEIIEELSANIRTVSGGAPLSRAERLLKVVETLRSSGGRVKPEALIDSLKQQGIDVELHQSRDGKGSRIVIIPPSARENPEFIKDLREYFQVLDGQDGKERS